MRSIPIAKPIIYEEEIKAVEEVLRAGMLAQGEAVIPAAGLGTRFLPVTKSMPKEMLPIIGKPPSSNLLLKRQLHRELRIL